MARSPEVRTPEVKYAFARGLTIPQTKRSGREQYEATLLIAKGVDLTALRDACVQAVVAEWGESARDDFEKGLIPSPIHDGDGIAGCNKKTGMPNNGFAGCNFIRVSSGVQFPPDLVDHECAPLGPRQLYSGCYGYAIVTAFTLASRDGARSVLFGITAAQVTREGPRLDRSQNVAIRYFQKIADPNDMPEMRG